MTDAELDMIESKLGIALPQAYRDLMRTRVEELKGLKREMWERSYCCFEESLYFDAVLVIETNMVERRPDAGTEYGYPGWWKTYFLFGSNGAADYYCLRLNGDHEVCMIGSNFGDASEEIYESLGEFVDAQIREFAETAP